MDRRQTQDRRIVSDRRKGDERRSGNDRREVAIPLPAPIFPPPTQHQTQHRKAKHK